MELKSEAAGVPQDRIAIAAHKVENLAGMPGEQPLRPSKRRATGYRRRAAILRLKAPRVQLLPQCSEERNLRSELRDSEPIDDVSVC